MAKKIEELVEAIGDEELNNALDDASVLSEAKKKKIKEETDEESSEKDDESEDMDDDEEEEEMDESFDISEDVKEHLDSIFKGEELSEEFSEKVRNIFESAVIATAKKVVEAKKISLEEKYQNSLDVAITVCEEELNEHKSMIDEKADKFFEFVVEEWYENNKPAVNNSIKNELTESFMKGLQNLFSEHYVNVPEEKIDLIEGYVAQIEELNSKVNSVLNENVVLKSAIKTSKKMSIINEAAKDLSESQKDKFVSLAENIAFKDEDKFKNNLEEILERYFDDEVEVVSITEEETPVLINEEVERKHILTEAQKVAEVMKKFSKFS